MLHIGRMQSRTTDQHTRWIVRPRQMAAHETAKGTHTQHEFCFLAVL
jgi:hypothetical protein